MRVSIDGRLVAAADALVPVTDRGFLYGDSVFETFRTYERRAHALERHMARLERSAAAVQIALPVSALVLADEIRALIATSNDERRIRLMITRGDAVGLADDDVRRVILSFPFTPHPPSRHRRGVACHTVRGARGLASAKAGSYLLSVLATREAHAAGAHEAILMDDEGLREGATSNVFVVDGAGTLRTASAGVLPGVTRGIVLELAHAAELAVREGPVSREELDGAQEVFLTSATREVMPVARIDHRDIGTPGPVTRNLLALYRESISARLDPERGPG